MPIQYWLLKSEPKSYSIDDLLREKKTFWDGVRNYQARNFLRDKIKKGDDVFFYHSNAEPSGIAGVAEVIRAGYPEPSQFDSKSHYYDPKSTPEKPIWFTVEIAFRQKFSEIIPLEALRKIKTLHDMPVLQRGQRLSVQPVAEKHWKAIQDLV